MGGEELDAFLWCLFVWFYSTRDTIERAFLVRGFPLTPRLACQKYSCAGFLLLHLHCFSKLSVGEILL